MQAPLQIRRASLHQQGRSIGNGSRILVVTNAKRRAVTKELQELKQLKDAPAPAPSTPPPPPQPQPATAPGPQAASAPAASAAAPAAPAPAASAPSPAASSSTPGPSGSEGGEANVGFFDSLLFRIPAAVVAIMAVISVFYSIVFYGASNAVVVFKDQLASITKKDFVPYSERRRMEQEVLAKLEAEVQERQRAQQAAAEAAAAGGAGADAAGAEAAAAAAPTDGAGSSSADLINLLPLGGRR